MKGVTRQTGIICDIDEKAVRVRVTLPECDNLRSNWLPVLQRNTQENKDYWLPDIGEQVEALLDDNGEDGVVLGAVYSTVDTAPLASRDKRYVHFSDGAAFEYDRKTHQLTINGGIEKILIEIKDTTRLTSPQIEVKAQQVLVTSDSVNVKAEDVSIEATTVDVKALDVTVDAPISTFKGNVTIMKKLTWLGGMMGSGGAGNSAAITGNVNVQGNVNVSGSVMDGGGNSNHHSHGQ
ncbi:TPA: phage baseplate assembly protein V [Enterobacter hormaechei]|uniref:phage baseplate assembly protein V n=1 Tax=Enterobacter hormaechei TaxID=158836 RepID=UPI0007961A08|nr:phage baseplate assembly protein V [Enterobacter hormaechei]MCU3017646.1 phage baseplate assembly protein V [Enterobacter hormaechei subsp. oharae]MCU3615329.1 phage baseplate assembly protein V [Enterobacter hormaechei subsp. oharae]CZV10500.1 Phage lower baseplate protein (TP901-1-like ORF49) [Enterobacter hormaechei]CZV26175.1 Phage lower baseplate protein (TP901-1-like ORF49) [Enterobacter hormaechei]CZV54294.1 Phage lower baseplate protein (TP901-1-like ORF49) [Enterobacter hormaechei]